MKVTMKLTNFIYIKNATMPVYLILLALSIASCGTDSGGNVQSLSIDSDSTNNTASRDLPLIYIEDFDYQGGFRIKHGTYGDTDTGYSKGRIAYNNSSHSLFVSGHVGKRAIGEFLIPDLIKSYNYGDLLISQEPIQNFSVVLDRTDTGNIQGFNRLGGIMYRDNELLVHGYDSYDGNADNTHTSVLLRDASDLKGSERDGFFEFEGAAHLVNWISPIDNYWKDILGADLISGGANAMSINSRLSMGPSLFLHNSSDIFGSNKTMGSVDTESLLDFSTSRIFAPTEQGWASSELWNTEFQYNQNGDNDLYTQQDAGGWYGQILPGTRTYAVFGQMGMGFSGGGYKITRTDGGVCGGPCPRMPEDYYAYYWFFDMNDLLEVKAGNKQPYEVKPYSYGVFPIPFNNPLGGGTYDEVNKLIYFSIIQIDRAQNRYEPPAVIVAYNYSIKDNYDHLLSENFYDLWIKNFNFDTNSEDYNPGINDTAHIYWKSVGFDTCVASDGAWSGDLNKVGFKKLKITSPTQNYYEITCSNKRTGFTMSKNISFSISN